MLYSISGQSYISKIDVNRSQVSNQFGVDQSAFDTYEFDEALFKKILLSAPAKRNASSTIISLPYKGKKYQFEVYESPCMMPGISARYPNIKSYKIINKDDRTKNGRIAISPERVEGVFMSDHGTIYFDPLSNDSDHYIFYEAANQINNNSNGLACGQNTSMEDGLIEDLKENTHNSSSHKAAGAIVEMRTYRTAIALTGEFVSQRTNGTLEDALARLNLSVNRVNQILENELSIHINLVDNNDEIIWFDPFSDPYSVGISGRTILDENTLVLNNNIGFQNYDWGHVYTASCNDVGGVAYPGVICNHQAKGAGVTCHFSGNMEAVAVATVSHEMGHQMSARHTWSSCGNPDQFQSASNFEPGSGSTILSYAGSCGSDNIQGTNDDYYHSGSLSQIFTFMRQQTGNSCATLSDHGNHSPDIHWPYENGFYIPIETPFELDAEATDIDGDEMTYTWEQRDSSSSSTPLGSPEGNNALFRVYPPTSETIRHFPRLDRILNNISTNVEILPFYERGLTFAFVVRDNNPEGGAVSMRFIKFNATDDAGPFVIETQNNFENYEVGDIVSVEWDVANTDISPVNAESVEILLSTDGGLNFDYVLSNFTANDGQEDVFIPNAISDNCRIKIKAVNNIFFDINDFDFSISAASQPSYIFDVPSTYINHCAPDDLEIPIGLVPFAGYESMINFETVNLPVNVTSEFSSTTVSSDGETNLVLDFSAFDQTQDFSFDILAVSELGDSLSRTIIINGVSTNFDDLSLVFPESNLSGATETPYFEWTLDENALSYTFELSTNPEFNDNETTRVENLTENNISLVELLEKSTVYFWRVIPYNECGRGKPTAVNGFSTVILDCEVLSSTDLPKNISQSGLAEIQSGIFLPESGTVVDVSVDKVRGLHQNTGDLVFSLISPKGTEVILADNKCNFRADFNCGFDDESSNSISCPLSTGKTFIPENDLSIFDGEEKSGEWKLVIKDEKSGDGGQFNEFRLEICAASTAQNPFIINNETLKVPRGARDLIDNSKLLVGDDNNSADELLYTFVTVAQHGELTVDGEKIKIGDQISQSQVDNGIFKYEHVGNQSTTDFFRFTVLDGEGGWVGITNFNIEIDDDFSSSTEDINDDLAFEIYPMPVQESLFLVSKEKSLEYTFDIYNLSGQLINSGSSKESLLSIDTATLKAGQYIIKISTETGIQVKKFLKI